MRSVDGQQSDASQTTPAAHRRNAPCTINGLFAPLVAMLLILSLAAPAIYLETLQQKAQTSNAHPLAVNRSFVAILAHVASLWRLG